jgi:predicted dehydrogenase
MNPPRKLKIGVVGCGVVATAYYLPWLRKCPEAELVAVCDTYPERTAACVRLFGVREAYTDYLEMIRRADIEAVWILTAPGTHVKFTLAALAAGKHVLLQKPMALDLAGARAIVEATRRTKLKVLVEPSAHSPMDGPYAELRRLVRAGVLGAPYWFKHVATGTDQFGHPSLGGNPYGVGAFYARDSGGILFDYSYGPNQIVTVLGACRAVTATATIAVPDRAVVSDRHYNAFLAQCTDPDEANYWRVVVGLPRDQAVKMEAPDNVFCLYEMRDGTTGVFHVGRTFQPTLPPSTYGGFQVFGSEGNLVFGCRGHRASLYSTRRDLLPRADAQGWCHWEPVPCTPQPWPIAPNDGFNYYHASSRELIACIREDRDPVLNVEWGLHITEMMTGALEAARTGRRYEMTSSLDW